MVGTSIPFVFHPLPFRVHQPSSVVTFRDSSALTNMNHRLTLKNQGEKIYQFPQGILWICWAPIFQGKNLIAPESFYRWMFVYILVTLSAVCLHFGAIVSCLFTFMVPFSTYLYEFLARKFTAFCKHSSLRSQYRKMRLFRVIFKHCVKIGFCKI